MTALEVPAAVAGRTVGQWWEIATSQAAALNRQAEQIRALVRERDTALSGREAALDLAEQYARRAGVDVDRDAVLRYVGQYWQLRARQDASWERLEGQRWEVLNIAGQLIDLVAGTVRTDLDVPGLAGLIARSLRRVATAQQPRRAVAMFARPAAPGVSTLEETP